MGYDIMAYFDVNQKQIDEFINTNKIDINDSKQHKLIIDFYKQQHPGIEKLGLIYIWNKKCSIHEIFDFQGTNFIRDDERFRNRRYQQILAEKHNREFPRILTNINWNLSTAKDAIQIADELTIFFGDDEDLMYFAEWLRLTSKYCSTYEYSY